MFCYLNQVLVHYFLTVSSEEGTILVLPDVLGMKREMTYRNVKTFVEESEGECLVLHGINRL